MCVIWALPVTLGTVMEEIAPQSKSPSWCFTWSMMPPRLLTPEEAVRGGVLDPEVAAPHWSGWPPTACTRVARRLLQCYMRMPIAAYQRI